jgi:hypothetical protein
MTYRPSNKYGLGRRNQNTPKSLDIDESQEEEVSELVDGHSQITTPPIFVIFNSKSLTISAEELNASNLWTRKLTPLQLGTTFLKEYDTNVAVENITKEESEKPNLKPYNKQIICFSLVHGGLLNEIITALQDHSPDTIITIDIHNQDVNLIKDEVAKLKLEVLHIIAASGEYLAKLEEQSSNLEQTIKEVERQLKVSVRKLEALKHDLSRRPTSKSLMAEVQTKQGETDIISQHLHEFLQKRKNYVTFNFTANENEDLISKKIRNLYRVWQGEVAKRENMGNEHGVIDKEELKLAQAKKHQQKLQKHQERLEQVKLAKEKRDSTEAEERKKKEESIPRVLGIRIW